MDPFGSGRFLGQKAIKVWLRGVVFPVLLHQQVFTNEDDSIGIVYLISDNLEITAQEISANYEKRWKVEEYHKSIKSYIGIEKSLAHTVRTQSNHILTIFLPAYMPLVIWKNWTLVEKKSFFHLKSSIHIGIRNCL